MGPEDLDDRLAQALLALIADRDPTATICPSEVARAVGSESSPRRVRTGAS